MTDEAIELAAIWLGDRDDSAELEFADRHGSVGDGITVGTVLEYDNWQWALVSELALDLDVPKIGFILLDELNDSIIKRLESADGCRQHYATVEHLRHSEHEYWTSVEYVLENDVWAVLGPIHPDYRKAGSSEREADEIGADHCGCCGRELGTIDFDTLVCECGAPILDGDTDV